MATSNLNPAGANGPITLTCNLGGTRLQPGQSVAATITLTLSSAVVDVTNFSVQITSPAQTKSKMSIPFFQGIQSLTRMFLRFHSFFLFFKNKSFLLVKSEYSALYLVYRC